MRYMTEKRRIEDAYRSMNEWVNNDVRRPTAMPFGSVPNRPTPSEEYSLPLRKPNLPESTVTEAENGPDAFSEAQIALADGRGKLAEAHNLVVSAARSGDFRKYGINPNRVMREIVLIDKAVQNVIDYMMNG